jgi:hypothetical protein
MEQEELEEGITDCAGCGAAVDPATDLGFTFGTRSVLCFECATTRGGRYDAPEERWVVPPDLTALEQDPLEA